MTQYENLIMEMIDKNKGFVTTKEVTGARIPRRCLTSMVKSDIIYRADRGVYVLPEVFEDEMYILQYRYSKGIFSHETALFFHMMSDRAPITYTMTFPSGYNTKNVKKKDIIVKLSKESNYKLGVITIHSIFGNPIKVYDLERTICDILLTRNNTDIQIITQAMQMYARSRDKDLYKLMRYAEKLNIKSKVTQYMQILL